MSRFSPFKTALTRSGWAISQADLTGDIWWAAEIWTLSSTWTPVGAEAYVTLLVDPMSDGRNPTDVWAVGVSAVLPHSHLDGAMAHVPIKHRFDPAVKDVVALAQGVRASQSNRAQPPTV